MAQKQHSLADAANVNISTDDTTGALLVSATISGGGDASAANQTTQITAEQAIQATAGATSGAAVVTDANGTLQQYLRGLVKLWIAGLAAGENHIGSVGGTTAQITPSLTVSTTPAYSSGDNVGGKLTLSNIVRVSGGSGVIQSLLVVDASNQKAAFDVLLFNADPTNTTFTDNGALTINSADVAKIVRRISVAASDYVTVGGVAVAEIAVGGKPIVPASGTTMYAAVVTTSTPTYAATTALIVRLGVLQD